MASQDVIERALVSGSPDTEAPALVSVLTELIESQRETPARLHPEDRRDIIEGTIAGVVEYLRTQPGALATPEASSELISAKQAAERWPALGQRWFYDNKTELGAIFKGNGSVKPRMLFDPRRIEEVLEQRQAGGPQRSKPRAGTPRQSPRSRAKAAGGDADRTPSGNPRLTRSRRKVRSKA